MNPNTNIMTPDPVTGGATATTGTPSSANMSGKTVWYWLGLALLLVVLVVVARKAGGEEDFRNIRPTAYNFLTITLTAIVGIVGLKVIAAKYHIPGASEIILAA